MSIVYQKAAPPLIEKVYSADTLDKTLDENIKKSFKTPENLKIDGKILYLTLLFKWYEQDFVEQAGSVKDFIFKYVHSDIKTKIKKNRRRRIHPI